MYCLIASLASSSATGRHVLAHQYEYMSTKAEGKNSLPTAIKVEALRPTSVLWPPYSHLRGQ